MAYTAPKQLLSGLMRTCYITVSNQRVIPWETWSLNFTKNVIVNVNIQIGFHFTKIIWVDLSQKLSHNCQFYPVLQYIIYQKLTGTNNQAGLYVTKYLLSGLMRTCYITATNQRVIPWETWSLNFTKNVIVNVNIQIGFHSTKIIWVDLPQKLFHNC